MPEQRRSIIQIIWNGIGLAALLYLAWTGFTTLRQQSDPAAANVVMEVSPAILNEIREVNKQIFIEHYNTIPIKYSEAPKEWAQFLGNIGITQEYVVLLRGQVSAGFDLSTMSEADIWVSADHKRAQVTLPPPQIFEKDVVLDLEHSEVIATSDHCPDLLCSTELQAYQTNILPEGRKRLIEAAQRNQILQQAATKGQQFYEKLLNNTGIAEVRVVIRGYSE